MDSLEPPQLLTYPQFQNQLRVEFARARRYAYPLTVAAATVDRLDHLRDIYGAEVKRNILVHVVQVFRNSLRLSDITALQHDRILLALPHTDEAGAQIMASRMSQQVRDLRFDTHGKTLEISISMGLCNTSAQGPLFYDAMVKNAQSALQEAAQSGGSETRFHRDPVSPS